jgi:hypothetical protein
MASPEKPSNEHYNIANALSAALEPLIDVCLKAGITSPELEGLLRAAFVQRAFKELPRHTRTGRGPSDSRVSIATGVHRMEVAKIRSAGGTTSARKTMQTRERLYSKSARVLNGWKSDTRYTTSGGVPLDLPLESNKQQPSFEDLVTTYAPGNHPGTVLKELRRKGNVRLLDGEIVRLKSTTTRSKGVTAANVGYVAQRMKGLGETLFQNILDPEQARLYFETGKIALTSEQLALLRPVIERRAKTFLQALEDEFGLLRSPGKGAEAKTMSVGVFSWHED